MDRSSAGVRCGGLGLVGERLVTARRAVISPGGAACRARRGPSAAMTARLPAAEVLSAPGSRLAPLRASVGAQDAARPPGCRGSSGSRVLSVNTQWSHMWTLSKIHASRRRSGGRSWPSGRWLEERRLRRGGRSGETCSVERSAPPFRLDWAVCPSQETPGRRTVRGEATPPIGYSACSGQLIE
jgi:hypothetical protein